jgi:hypothetical protein
MCKINNIRSPNVFKQFHEKKYVRFYLLCLYNNYKVLYRFLKTAIFSETEIRFISLGGDK